MDAVTLSDIEARYPEAMRGQFGKRLVTIVGFSALVLYVAYCWWFFAIGTALQRASVDIAGAYLADWISWEARPDVDIADDGAMSVAFPRYSPLGTDPQPAWIALERTVMTRQVRVDGLGSDPQAAVEDKISNSFMVPDAQGTIPRDPGSSVGFMAPGAAVGSSPDEAKPEIVRRNVTEEVVTRAAISMGQGKEVIITPDRVVASRDGVSLTVALDRVSETVTVLGDLPTWAQQKYAGRKVLVWFGFDGRIEIDHDGVKIRRRFLGWENFVFDTLSPFWGKPLPEVVGMIVSGERIDPQTSNLSLAWRNFLHNSEWQHLDVWTKLLQTIVMAFVGTLFACILAFPLAFFAARNITPSRFVNQVSKRLFDFLRSVDMLIWALFFTRAFGPGPLAGISAIFFTDTGTFGKLFSEALENVDDRQREGVVSVGAKPIVVQRFGILPQVLPVFLSQVLYFWEANTRSATIIGAVGAGGIGLKLWEAMRTNQDWENVAYMVILVLVVVYVFDTISSSLRLKLVGKTAD